MMKRYGWLTTFGALAFVAQAQALTIGVEGGMRYLSYGEVVEAPLKSTQHGMLPSFGGYVESRSLNYFLRGGVEYASANLTYDGTTQPPEAAPVSSVDPHNFLIYHAEAGLGLGHFGGSLAYIYVGASYRIWHRQLSNPNETYNLLTLPVGLRVEPMSPGFLSTGLDLSFREMIHGSVKVEFASQYDTLTVPVKRAWGFRAEVPVTLVGTQAFRVYAKPYFELSRITQGDPRPLTSGGVAATQNGQALQVLEPSSHTYQYGGDLALEMSF